MPWLDYVLAFLSVHRLIVTMVVTPMVVLWVSLRMTLRSAPQPKRERKPMSEETKKHKRKPSVNVVVRGHGGGSPGPPGGLPSESHPMPVEPPRAIEADKVKVDSEPDHIPDDGKTYRVAYATNRKPVIVEGKDIAFSPERSTATTYGNCDVFIPKSHKIGSVGSPGWKRLLSMTDDRLVIERTSILEEDAFWRSLNSRIDGQDHAVVFIHGYRVSFEEAVIRAAQIGVDLTISAMAVFSWPSKGGLKDYATDEATIESSTGAITSFLVDFAKKSDVSAVHIIAHSMGNRGVLRAIERIAGDAERRSGIKFGQIILAAADVDADSFREMAAAYKCLSARTTLYVSAKDKALSLSAWVHDYPRVGFTPPISIFDGIDTINVTNLDVSLLGHGYVGDAREVLTDMHQLIFSGLPPDKRFLLRPAKTDQGQPYWEVGA